MDTARLIEVKGDLFKSPYLSRPGVMIAHCISADYALGAGFALTLESKYHIRDKLKQVGKYTYPDCILMDGILNLVTKGAYWTKPTYETFEASLYMAREICINTGTTILVMPRIGCGLDKLDWKVCKGLIETILVSSGINCAVYRLK